MKKTLIIGASGQIGKKLTQLMLNDGNDVVALVRDKSKLSDITDKNLHVIEADLTGNFGHAFKQCTNVVFVAGSGGETGADKTILIDLWAACRSADYAKENAVKHFILVSSIGADAPSTGPESIQPYLIAKHVADEHLMRSGLHYSIVRPGTLTNDDAKGKFTTERPAQKGDATVTREDVAKALLFIVNNPSKENTLTELFNGSKNISETFK
ncbi:SDR family oxidoreductase [Colwellia sp. PAMC 21821]|uniref:SDR family oxidoreductase n=1 Tax=Colwellia sp. PAMC 21821 TaxID=1816219 RepID=UPI0009C0B447|nr:SDR family oxidoreductase [Colwellia sp. PAMC 21821]ARD44284.1 oxidoreductase [Colwellia sp. PAMC 21821]